MTLKPNDFMGIYRMEEDGFFAWCYGLTSKSLLIKSIDVSGKSECRAENVYKTIRILKYSKPPIDKAQYAYSEHVYIKI